MIINILTYIIVVYCIYNYSHFHCILGFNESSILLMCPTFSLKITLYNIKIVVWALPINYLMQLLISASNSSNLNHIHLILIVNLNVGIRSDKYIRLPPQQNTLKLKIVNSAMVGYSSKSHFFIWQTGLLLSSNRCHVPLEHVLKNVPKMRATLRVKLLFPWRIPIKIGRTNHRSC